MRRTTTGAIVAAWATLFAAQLNAAVIPPSGLAPGQPYQLVFLTEGTIAGTSTDVSTYNNFVKAQAALEPTLPTTTWKAIVSTSSIDASANAPWLNLPVYDTAGRLVTLNPSADFYTSEHAVNMNYTQHGIEWGAEFAFTGSNASGHGVPGFELGSGNMTVVGRTDQADRGNWMNRGNFFSTDQVNLYALSGPIGISVPEPSSLTLLGLGLAVVGGSRWRRWRRRA